MKQKNKTVECGFKIGTHMTSQQEMIKTAIVIVCLMLQV